MSEQNKQKNMMSEKKKLFWDDYKISLTWFLGIASLALSALSLAHDVGVFLMVLIICLVVIGGLAILTYKKIAWRYYYINQQIKYMRKAKKIKLLIRSIHTEQGSDKIYRKFNKVLKERIEDGADVKVLTYCVYDEKDERIPGAEEMYGKGIKVMFSKELKRDNDFRYLLTDDKYFVISQQKFDRDEPSEKCVVFTSKNLAEREKAYFDNLWSKAIDLQEYLDTVQKSFENE